MGTVFIHTTYNDKRVEASDILRGLEHAFLWLPPKFEGYKRSAAEAEDGIHIKYTHAGEEHERIFPMGKDGKYGADEFYAIGWARDKWYNLGDDGLPACAVLSALEYLGCAHSEVETGPTMRGPIC